MLAENASWINFVRNKIMTNNLSCNSLSSTVEGQCNMPLVNLSMQSHTAINYQAIVSKHEAPSPDRDTKVAKGSSKICNLLNVCPSRRIL